MDLNTYGIYISIKNQRTSPIKVSSIDLMRAECHDRLSIANGCSRDVVLSHVKKLPQAPMPTVLKSRFKKGKAGILSQKMLFPPRVVVDFFFDEEERRYAITRRQRKEHKKGEKLARASQNSPYSNPLCPFFPSSFHSFNLPHAGGEIQKRSICISKTERKQTMKKRAPTLPPTIIDRGLSMIAMRVTFSRACARARKKKVILCARKCAQKCARESEEEMKKKCVF